MLGKFAHLSKRRVQIDTYFISQFMELAYKCENDLPADILEKAMSKVRHDADSKGIAPEDQNLTTGLNNIPLYNPG